jgi:hypothetical protein
VRLQAGGAAAGSKGHSNVLDVNGVDGSSTMQEPPALHSQQQQQQQWHWQHVGLGRRWQQQPQQQQQQQPSVLFADEPVGAILSALHAALAVLAPAAAGDAAAAAADGLVAGVDACTGDAAAAAAAAQRKLSVLGDYMLQWLSEHVDNLGCVRRVLRGLEHAGKQHAGFRDVAERVVGVAQQWVQQRYGFVVQLAS